MNMKNILLTLLFMIPSILYSQNINNTEKPNTKIEKLLKEEGLVLKKDFFDIIKINTYPDKLEFSKMVITDLKLKTQTKGVYIYAFVQSTTLSQSGSCYIDDNKLLGLIEFLELVNDKVKNKEINQVEYIFNLENLKVTLFNSKRNLNKIYVKDEEEFNYWNLSIDVGRIRSAEFKLKNLEEISNIITKLKEVDFK